MSLITAPGLYDGVPEADYHSGAATSFDSLSCSDCKLLARPGGPALWKWRQDHPEPPRATFDLGSAVHSLVLGAGPQPALIEGEWRSKDAKAGVAQARADGRIPLHEKDFATVTAMAEAVAAHPVAAGLLAACPHREASGYVQRGDDLWLRCRFDAIGDAGIVDLKTCLSADPETFARKAIDLGYHMQAAHYRQMAQQLGVTDGPFWFMCVEKTPPFLVSVIEMDEDTEQLGRDAMNDAIETYRRCRDTDTWPGYDTQIHTVSAPPWAFTDPDEHLDPTVERELLDLLKGTQQ